MTSSWRWQLSLYASNKIISIRASLFSSMLKSSFAPDSTDVFTFPLWFWAKPWLADTDNRVFYYMYFGFIHVLLLFVKFPDCQQKRDLFPGGRNIHSYIAPGSQGFYAQRKAIFWSPFVSSLLYASCSLRKSDTLSLLSCHTALVVSDYKLYKTGR